MHVSHYCAHVGQKTWLPLEIPTDIAIDDSVQVDASCLDTTPLHTPNSFSCKSYNEDHVLSVLEKNQVTMENRTINFLVQ